ncbi:MAG: class I SAM-dependent methyltransferase [Salinirussus sp.]
MKGEEWYQADEIAESYEAKRFSRGGRLIDRREKQAVLDALGPVDDRDILEIACGTGRFAVMLAKAGADVVGLDVSGPMLQQGRAKAKTAEPAGTLSLLRGDAGRLPFPDNSFDAVLAMRFFHLADTPHRFLAEMRRVSRSDVFFDTFNRFSARSIYNWALPMGSRLYSSGEVDRLLADAGLSLVKADHDWIAPYGVYRKLPSRLASALRRADIGVRRTPLGRPLATVSYWHARI